MMSMRGVLCVALMWSAACGEDEPASGPGDTGGTLGGTTASPEGGLGEGGAPEGGANGATTQLDPNEIPAAFAAYDATSCGSLGQSCSFAGGSACEGALCNLTDEICVPETESLFTCVPGGCDAATPYCIGGQCLDFDSASCLCGAEGGAALAVCAVPAVSALAAEVQSDGSVCLVWGGRCGAGYACCEGLECRTDSAGNSICDAPCGAIGDVCGGATRCCDETAMECVVFDGEADFTCHARCTSDAECDEGCCIPLNDDSGTSVCLGAELCPDAGSCVGKDETCSADIACCDTLVCVVPSNGTTGSCAPTCTTDTDCASGCCVPFTTAEGGFCAKDLDCS